MVMQESSRNEQVRASGSPQALALARSGEKRASPTGPSQQLANSLAAGLGAANGSSLGGQQMLPSSLDYILSLAVKQHQHQQLMQQQRHLQQLQHLQHLQQIQQQQNQQQQHQNNPGRHQQASALAAAAAAAAALHQHQHPHHLAPVGQPAQAQHLHHSTNQQQQQSQQHNSNNQSQHRRQYNPAATLHYLATNECRVIDYRGHRIAAFLSTPNPAMLHHLQRAQGGQPIKPGHSEHLLCLPQAFEVFLKHLVGGLHTVYTKLKRLDIVPIVCNVEQVRILRGLGAIQPGVNRCKLLSTHDFDILFKDCTTAR